MKSLNIKKVLFAILPLVFYLAGGFLLGMLTRTISVNGGFEDLAFFLSGMLIGIPIYSIIYGIVGFRVYRNIWIPAVINTATVVLPIVLSMYNVISALTPLVIVFGITLIASVLTRLVMIKNINK